MILSSVGCCFVRKRRLRSKTFDSVDTVREDPLKPLKGHLIQTDPSISIDTANTVGISSPGSEKYFTSELSSPKLHETKLTLPLLPPSTSLFSDKMELNSDEALELYSNCMIASQEVAESKQERGFVSIEFERIQQKAATIKNTLHQSIRRQKSLKLSTDVHHLFSSSEDPLSPPINASLYPQRIIETKSRDVLPKSPIEGASAVESLAVRSQIKPFNTFSIRSTPPEDWVSSPVSIKSQHMPSEEKKDQDGCDLADTPLKEVTAVHAARRVIRSASRKMKTRSVLINEDAVTIMFSQPLEELKKEGTTSRIPPIPKTEESNYYASVRSRDPTTLENITITSGSVRRLVRDSIVTEGRATVSAGVCRSPNPGAREIANWWHKEAEEAQTHREEEEKEPSMSVAGLSRLAPPVGTYSAASKTLAVRDMHILSNKGEGVTRSGSKRASTLGRSSQKPPASLNGVKSLKNLFESPSKTVSHQKPPLSQRPVSLWGERKQNASYPPEICSETETQALDSAKYAITDQDMAMRANDYATKEKPTGSKRGSGSVSAKKGGEIATLRRMLQSTWTSSMNGSESTTSIHSERSSASQAYADSAHFVSVRGQSIQRPSVTHAFSEDGQTSLYKNESTRDMYVRGLSDTLDPTHQHPVKDGFPGMPRVTSNNAAQTWSGRAHKNRSGPSQCAPIAEVSRALEATSIGRSKGRKAIYNTLRTGSQQRGSIPWNSPEEIGVTSQVEEAGCYTGAPNVRSSATASERVSEQSHEARECILENVPQEYLPLRS
ncbi:hypothetical protein BDF14DRAFT_1877550 [Spinellus fusiger]|nr:hypothetical protein BDF14DRAFT_1877550 [Spinellus fusiger]